MFWLVRLLVMVCIFAVGSIPMVYADSHEMGEEMEMAEEESSGASGWFRTDTDSLGNADLGWCEPFPKFPRWYLTWIPIFMLLILSVS